MQTEINGDKLNFEDAIQELEQLVNTLERGNIDLDKAIELYNRGNFLKAYCDNKLNQAKLKVEKIMIQEDNEISIINNSEV